VGTRWVRERTRLQVDGATRGGSRAGFPRFAMFGLR
jgi:hypothetical protein